MSYTGKSTRRATLENQQDVPYWKINKMSYTGKSARSC
jgi:hypothetical protein